MASIRYFSNICTDRSLAQLKSCVFASLASNRYVSRKKRNAIATRHPLDTQQKEYLQVVNKIIIPACQDIVPKEHVYHDHVGKALKHTLFIFDTYWSFSSELAFEILAPPIKHTEENLKRIRILRATQDIMYAMLCLIDDIVEEAPIRFNKPTWHTFCPGGETAAIYDSFVFGFLPLFITTKFFRNETYYGQILQTFSKASIGTLVGQSTERICLNWKNEPNVNEGIIAYQGGRLQEAGPVLGMLLAGYSDFQLINQIQAIFHHFGIALQIWDDFLEAHSGDLIRKETVDSATGNISWAASVALKTLEGNQLLQFKECYGSPDPAKRKTVEEIYQSLDLPLLYLKEMRHRAYLSMDLIEKLPDEKCKKLCYSYMDWLIGDEKDLEIVHNYIARH